MLKLIVSNPTEGSADENYFELQIITLEAPYLNWDQQGVPDLFQQIITLKKAGYERFYPENYLPVDTIDFIGTHHLICRKTSSGFKVLAGIRSVTYEQCQNYYLDFPLIGSLVRDQNTNLHVKAMMSIIERTASQKRPLSYGSAWTMDPEERKNPGFIELCKDLARAMLYEYHTHHHIDEELCIGLISAKTEAYFKELGYFRATFQNKELPPFFHSDIGGKEVYLLHRQKFTDVAKQAYERHKALFDQKITIERPIPGDAAKKKAA